MVGPPPGTPHLEPVPPATFALLQGLKSAHENAFPVHSVSSRPDLGDEDTVEGRARLSQQNSLIRCVLGGWIEILGKELGKSGGHNAKNGDALTTLAEAIPGSLSFFTLTPGVLLFRPLLPTRSEGGGAQEGGGGRLQGLGNKMEMEGAGLENELDLATYLFPRILSATSSLEVALLSTAHRPLEGEHDAGAELYRKREALRCQLEEMMGVIVKVLLESAVGVEWKAKDQVVEGGIGKGRQLVQEMITLLKALMSPSGSTSSAFPQKYRLFASSLSPVRPHHAPNDPFDPHQSIQVHSALHVYALIFTLLRILLQTTTTSLFLADFVPTVHQLMLACWPTGLGAVEGKGKGRMEEIRSTLLETRLQLASIALENVSETFASLLHERMAVQACEVLKMRFHTHLMDEVEGEDRIDVILAEIFAKIWRRAVGRGMESNVRQVMATMVLELGSRMVECLLELEAPLTELAFISLLILSIPLLPPAPASPERPATSAIELLPPEQLLALGSSVANSPTLPFDISHHPLLLPVARQAWSSLRAGLATHLKDVTSSSQRKRRRLGPGTGAQVEVAVPEESMGAPVVRKNNMWKAMVGQLLRDQLGVEPVTWETEGLQSYLSTLARSLPTLHPKTLLKTLKLLGLVGCARDGTLSYPSSSDGSDEVQLPTCSRCAVRLDVENSPTDYGQHSSRALTNAPLEALRSSAHAMLKINQDAGIQLAYTQAMTRMLQHAMVDNASISFGSNVFADLIFRQLEAPTRTLRLSAGDVILSMVRAHQEREPSIGFVNEVSARLDDVLAHKSPAVLETSLIVLGRIARLSIPQGWLECQCVTKLVSRLGLPNMFLKSVVRTQFEQVATFRHLKPYALVQPHFETISPVLVESMQTSPATIAVALDCFQQSRDAVLRITREYTLPKLILSDQMSIVLQIAEASDTTVALMLVDATTAPAIFAYLYMQSDKDTKRGLTVYMREAINAVLGSGGVTLLEILNSVKIPLVYRLALQLGDDNPEIRAQAERALRSVERARNPTAVHLKTIDLGAVLKDSIVGILSLMNRGLNESTAHRPIRYKQKIIRSLEVVTALVGPAIAGFSPQIMATLQSALEVEGLRDVTLCAFKTFFSSLKFSEIGPFIGTTSATFVRLWSDFTIPERETAVKTLEYIVIQNADNLTSFVQDIADLSGIPELDRANTRLEQIRRSWSFSQRSDYLLTRIGSENDVVSLQALKELKKLMLKDATRLQAYSSADTFDKSVGRLIKVVFSVAIKDGQENEAMRNLAFECIGILGALDPDRLDIVPSDSATIVLQNFTDREESIAFALHLIQDLLIGAYRSTNDTKHQEFLAFAIQELLRFCGFTVELVLPSSTVKTISPRIRERWRRLPKSVLETCGPLLGASFSFKEKVSGSPTVYPIYQQTSSYRDWIRSWATDLIAKLRGATVIDIFRAFPPVLRLEDIAVARHLLPHLVLCTLISGTDQDRQHVKDEMQKVLEDQVDPKHQQSENSRLLSAQTVFDLMDHLSRWINKMRQDQAKKKAAMKKIKEARHRPVPPDFSNQDQSALLSVEGVLQDIPHMLVAQAALTCKAYARSLLNYESRIVALRHSKTDQDLQDCFEKLHECYADLDEPDGMEGVSTKILSPSIWHQIREHESTGRWTSAQSCWEVKLQQSPEDPACHVGLLRCLRNLGHYDSMRTHIVGILHGGNQHSDWDRILAPFNIEASLIVSDWDAVGEALRIPDLDGPEVAFGRVITAMRQGAGEELTKAFHAAREQLGSPIVAAGKESYRRVYDSVIHLHILHELEMIRATSRSTREDLARALAVRLQSTSPTFRAREPILNMRRTAFSLDNSHGGREAIGKLWLETSKIARKAGHYQSAYSAILQANNLNADFSWLQSAKLLQTGDQMHKAIQEIDNALQTMLPKSFVRKPEAGQEHVRMGKPTTLAKASLRRARWMHGAGRLDENGIIEAYQEAGKLAPDWESPAYYLGHYNDQQYQAEKKKAQEKQAGNPSNALMYQLQTIKYFSTALSHGTKFIYQAMPRMLTIWFELAEDPALLEAVRVKKKGGVNLEGYQYEIYSTFGQINKTMDRNAAKRLPTYQWLTVLPQLVSRISHGNDSLFEVLEKVLLKVMAAYPHHTFWSMASGVKSVTQKRSKRCTRVFEKAKDAHKLAPSVIDVSRLINEGTKLVDQLLVLCNFAVGKETLLSLHSQFPTLSKLAPSTLIIPLQISLNVSLPSDASQTVTHRPFPDKLVTFHNFADEIEVMSSLQKPRKISIYGDDGATYAFLCKPKDDLRKDARLMEFNSMIIKLLKKDSESRNRQLSIRTYAVVPLNEECGLIEWVPNVVVLRTILNKSYATRGIVAWSPELRTTYETIRDDPSRTGERFEKEVLTKFPSVFHEWFLETFPEPSAWLRARLAYARTAAVISIVGFVLGLGDRHCENILLEGNTGDTVHVDFNCLFDKGRGFEVGEKVPFRLTHNIIDGMGVTGVEGVFRKAAEITLRVLRSNKESLTSVLEAFVHDPLVEWNNRRRDRDESSETVARNTAKEARRNLEPISLKLRGLQVTSDPASCGEKEVSVTEQVERLIREARSSKNLGSMYVGWGAFL